MFDILQIYIKIFSPANYLFVIRVPGEGRVVSAQLLVGEGGLINA